MAFAAVVKLNLAQMICAGAREAIHVLPMKHVSTRSGIDRQAGIMVLRHEAGPAAASRNGRPFLMYAHRRVRAWQSGLRRGLQLRRSAAVLRCASTGLPTFHPGASHYATHIDQAQPLTWWSALLWL